MMGRGMSGIPAFRRAFIWKGGGTTRIRNGGIMNIYLPEVTSGWDALEVVDPEAGGSHDDLDW
jgi:hypothetical protein